MVHDKHIVIVDIDGTLADATHRLHLLPSNAAKGPGTDQKVDASWDAFLDAADADGVYHHIRLISNLVASQMPVFLITGRKEKQRAMTEAWLRRHGITYHRLYMRGNDDHRPDTVVKFEEFQRIVADGFEPMFAIEDRKSVTRMWREQAGIPCLQVCEGDY